MVYVVEPSESFYCFRLGKKTLLEQLSASAVIPGKIWAYLTRDYYDGFINDRVKYGSIRTTSSIKCGAGTVGY